MKSKSPFAMKSPLLAYKSDMRGNYANPKYVKEELVGVKIGEALTKAGTDIFSGLTTKPKSESGDGSNGGSNITNNIFANGGGGESRKGSIEIPEIEDRSITPTTPRFPGGKGTQPNETPIPTSTPDDNYNTKLRKLITPGQKVEKLESNQETYRNSFNAGFAKNNEGYDNIDDYIKFKESKYQPKKQMFAQDYKNNVAQGDEYEVDIDNQKTNYSVMNMKGSPNKLIGDTMDPYGQINPGAVPPNQAQNDLGAQPIISANGSQPSNRSIDMSAISDPYSALGADFGAGTRNKAQSIYGSAGQRQGLMNLGTPLYHDSEKQAHSHPSKTTTKMKPDGEYPGARYVKGDLVDQDDLLDKTELDVHIATQVQSDKKGSFIKEMPDSGPGSNIETDKGFGKKIRLESMGRSSYTSNMKDQMDPHDFLFKNTPKK